MHPSLAASTEQQDHKIEEGGGQLLLQSPALHPMVAKDLLEQALLTLIDELVLLIIRQFFCDQAMEIGLVLLKEQPGKWQKCHVSIVNLKPY